jgi:hypothetical protein
MFLKLKIISGRWHIGKSAFPAIFLANLVKGSPHWLFRAKIRGQIILN